MKRRVDRKPVDPAAEREKLIGLGKNSISKSYYPELRKRLEELEHFRALMDRISDAIFVVDATTGTILDASGAIEPMLGCSASDITGKEFRELLPDHIARYAINLFSSNSEHLSLETEFNCSECSSCPPVPVELSIRTVKAQTGGRAVIVARDISERKRNEEALRKSHDKLEIRVRERTRELERANRAKSEFLSIVSHELRTPLTSVIGFTKLIRKKLLDTIYPAVNINDDTQVAKSMDTVEKNLDIIVSEGERLTSLINDVLDLAKLEANKLEFKRRPISPNEVISRAMDATSALFIESGLTLLTDIDSGLPNVDADFDRIIQVLVNLFSNAVKFTSQGTVTCCARLVEDHVRISVTDTGIGIPAPMLETIFDKFTQAKDTLDDERPRGTGLGLPICRKIIEAHHGHIWAESTFSGAKFVFTLPVIK
ncbi:ATP-binding protein [Pseudodesulfovibrio sp. zrk46]|uniref:PAS domain-containing sensor histidine kinase n=1 Tax=Pseudodesulfovibrio sp. zrk46 TaxID=2725288 RepID=UPI001448EB92|nr:ATP-binding protein [Pseudodesulfovibrio sp. zrk46]QJB56092.1 PAS domain S-box protein [Pseudodesulfovibrio sp. zrk46]